MGIKSFKESQSLNLNHLQLIRKLHAFQNWAFLNNRWAEIFRISILLLFSSYFDPNSGKFHVPSWWKVELLMVYTSQFVMWFHQHIPYFITLTLKLGQRKWNKNETDYKAEIMKLTKIEQILHHKLWLGTTAEENTKILLILSFFCLFVCTIYFVPLFPLIITTSAH